jgi:hypothetical protein
LATIIAWETSSQIHNLIVQSFQHLFHSDIYQQTQPSRTMVNGAVTAGFATTAITMMLPACVDVTGVSAATCLVATTGAVIGGAYHGIKHGIKHIRHRVLEDKLADALDGKSGNGQA